MSRDRLFAASLFTMGLLTLVFIGYWGRDYYFIPLAEKYTSELHRVFGPSGLWGHGLGIIGSVFMLLNFMYSWRKRFEFREKLGSLKLWLEFHMFVGLFGPTLVVYHSVFKFDGIIATVCFFSMVIVVITGIIGRYIYIQIPHNIFGAELGLVELENEAERLYSVLRAEIKDDERMIQQFEKWCQFPAPGTVHPLRLIFAFLKNDIENRRKLDRMIKDLRKKRMSEDFVNQIANTLKQTLLLSRKIILWSGSHKLLDTWRLLHKKLSWVLFITLAVHVLVTLLFGFTWIF